MIDEATGEEKVLDWYIKWEATNEISGPMTKAEAQEHTADGSGTAFSEGVFEPYTIPGEATELITELLSEAQDHRSSALCTRAAEMLALLARPREVTATINGGVFEIETIAQGVHLVVNDYDLISETTDEDEEGNAVCITEYGP